ncbi:CHAP domain-containing protein [Fulvivirga sediminis]|uniref:CHAP domain-containing protein n=1 Tax=Fulvivirga sediminis TaxID=2803949 RepID=A0A937F787_9BACT|nr:CHAP domain-containing protein [Fulvivirga sediminis]MBL3655549.1 CHAP domain-containing protein [Fulvivirga sediminis]
MNKNFMITISAIGIVAISCFWIVKNLNINPYHEVGEPIDSLNQVTVFYNGGVNHVLERNLTEDGYNLGLKYQCVEFVKRYYYEHLNHKMPDSYGHAKDFFNEKIKDGALNPARYLTQFTNPSSSRPQMNDLIIFKGHWLNRYGHVAIISKVAEDHIEIIQQNPGPFQPSREIIELKVIDKENWEVQDKKVIGWLRKTD